MTSHSDSPTAEPRTADEIGQEISEGIRLGGDNRDYTLPLRELLALTALMDEHPEWWERPCFCAECRSCADG